MFQWQGVEGDGLNPTHRVSWDLREFQLLSQTETLGSKNYFESEVLTRKSPTT
jgi:hypothetical protein